MQTVVYTGRLYVHVRIPQPLGVEQLFLKSLKVLGSISLRYTVAIMVDLTKAAKQAIFVNACGPDFFQLIIDYT